MNFNPAQMPNSKKRRVNPVQEPVSMNQKRRIPVAHQNHQSHQNRPEPFAPPYRLPDVLPYKMPSRKYMGPASPEPGEFIAHQARGEPSPLEEEKEVPINRGPVQRQQPGPPEADIHANHQSVIEML